tara:strand:+ start:482 stop:1279 length:798 start_codon:yes stop_codon:yes gene_type:complete
MTLGLVGKKIGMSREFLDSGTSVPVTVVRVEKGRVIDIYSKEKNGYSAVKLGFLKIKPSKLTNQMKGFFAKKNTEPKRILKEYRVDKTDNYKIGSEVGLEILKDTKFIDVRSKTVGKGFAGPMKRWNFSGLRATHGVSVSHRSHGSTGQRQDPGKVFKNKKMAGHMGSKFRTLLNLEIIRSDMENDLIYIKGSIPGSKNSTVFLRKSIKSINRKTTVEKEKVVKQVQGTAKKTEPKGEAKKDSSKEAMKKAPEKKETPKTEVKKK